MYITLKVHHNNSNTPKHISKSLSQWKKKKKKKYNDFFNN